MIRWQKGFSGLSKAAVFVWAKALASKANAAQAPKPSVTQGCA
jgi:hypothetical protein